jgi:hypothetical protein
MVTFETISDDLDNCATLSQNGNHYWYNDFTHHVSPATYGGSLVFPLFQNYMEHAEKQYGKSGSDRMWMASGVEVFDYLRVRDAAPMTWSSFGNQLRILIDRDSLPSELQKYALSLVIDADAAITSVMVNDVADFTYRATTPRKLINLEWSTPPIYSMTQGSAEQNVPNDNPAARDHIDIEQIEASGDVLISLSDKSSVHGQLSVYDMMGRAILVCDLHEDGIKGKIRLELPPRKAGIYLFRFVGDDGRILTGKCY